MAPTAHGDTTANVSCAKGLCSYGSCSTRLGDLHFGDVKLADVPAWIARRDKTPMGVYQGGIRSKLEPDRGFLTCCVSLSLAFWKFYRAYLDNKKPNLIWYTQIFMVASLLNFVFLAIPDRSKAHFLRLAAIDVHSFLEHYKWAKYH